MNERLLEEVDRWRKRQGMIPRFQPLAEIEARLDSERRTQAAQAAWRHAVATGADR